MHSKYESLIIKLGTIALEWHHGSFLRHKLNKLKEGQSGRLVHSTTTSTLQDSCIGSLEVHKQLGEDWGLTSGPRIYSEVQWESVKFSGLWWTSVKVFLEESPYIWTPCISGWGRGMTEVQRTSAKFSEVQRISVKFSEVQRISLNFSDVYI